MPTINLNYKTVKKALGNLSDDELKKEMAMFGTDLETLDKSGITVEVFANRPDMLSEFGFVRALQAFLNIKPGLRQYNIKPSGKKVIIKPSVKEVRPYTACAIVKNLKLDDEKIEQLIQLQEKLHLTFCRNRKKGAIGIYPSDKLEYPIEFFADAPKNVKFVPLGETREMNGLQILSRHKTGREFGHMLEGNSKFPFFKDSKGEVLSMPPIINSEFTGKISSSTTEVFIECSGFDLRFLKTLLNIVICDLAELGGEIFSMELVYPDKKLITPDLTPQEMKLDEVYVEELLGEKVNIKKALGKMGHDYSKGIVKSPPYRVDILHPIDIVEEIAIGHGYDNFKPVIPNISTIAKESYVSQVKRKIVEILIGLKLDEVFTFNVTNNRVQNTMLGYEEKIVEFSNSKSGDLSGLRRSMIPGLLEVLQKNANNEYPQKIFDMGTTFTKDKDQETGVLETDTLGVLLSGKDEDFTKSKQILEYLIEILGKSFKLKQRNFTEFIEGRAAEIIIDGKVAGKIGEIHPEVLQNFKLEMPCSAFELAFLD